MKNSSFKLRSTTVYPGERITVAIPLPEIYSNIPAYMPINIVHGKKAGPVLLVCAAIHGDEITGTEIIHKLLEKINPRSLSGTLIAIPVVNVYGLMYRSKTTPGEIDINTVFPGSSTGTIASRIANIISEELLSIADYCIDLHSGKSGHYYFPQIYTDFSQEHNKRLVKAFNIPVIIDISAKEIYSLRGEAEKREKPCFSFETGEALRFDKLSVATGLRGIINVMRKIEMIKKTKTFEAKKEVHHFVIHSIESVRSPYSGIVLSLKKLGKLVKKGELIAVVTDPFGSQKAYNINAPVDGILISENKMPLVNEGEKLFNIGALKHDAETQKNVEAWEEKTIVNNHTL